MPDGADVRFEMMKRGEIRWAVRYAASEPELGKFWKWHPSIHMPRPASRINLEVTKVRVERLQDITNTDILAEGLPKEITPENKGMRWQWEQLWNAINGGRGFGWEKNPWVWVIEFKRLEATA
jgi:hypothetical protein